jgi:hypothetical protein
MSLTIPEAVPYDGYVHVQWIPAIVDPTEPILAEVNAATAFAVECYLPDGGLTTGATTNVRDAGRLCMKVVSRIKGASSYTLTLQYVADQQGNITDNTPFDTFAEDAAGFMGIFYGLDVDNAIVAGDVMNLYQGVWGPQNWSNPTRNGDQTITQEFIVSNYWPNVAVLAVAST